MLTRDGAPYVLLRAGALVPLDRLGVDRVEGRTVVVDAGLPAPVEGVTALPLLARAVERACTDDEVVGRTIEVAHSGDDAWAGLLTALGARPKLASSARVAVSRWLGRRVLDARALADPSRERREELRDRVRVDASDLVKPLA